MSVADLARTDLAEDVEDAFKYSHLILATTTYNGDIFPKMKEFIHELLDRTYQNRTIGFIENGAWAPNAIKNMKSMLEGSKNLTLLENSVTLKGSLRESNLEEMDKMVEEIKL